MTTDTPSRNADIQLGDRVEILPIDPNDGGLPVYGKVVRYERLGNEYTVECEDGPHAAAGSRLRKRSAI